MFSNSTSSRMPGRYGSRSILVIRTRSALRNITGYLSGLSSPSVTERATTFSAWPRSKTAGQTRLPTFSITKRSRPRQSPRLWSALWASPASRGQAVPVVSETAGMPALRKRSALLSVARSPLIAPMRSQLRAPAVASSTAVLPEPGEPMRLIAKTPASSKCSRLCRAVRSLPERIRSWISTGTSSESPHPQESHIGHLHFNLFQNDFVPRRQPRPRPADGTLQGFSARERPAAGGALPDGRHGADLHRRARADRALPEDLVRGGQQLGIDAGELPQRDPDAAYRRGPPLPRLGFDALHQGPDDRIFVHGASFQQIRGSGSPSGSASNRRPKPVSSNSMPGGSVRQVPTISACRPKGWPRSAFRTLWAAPGRTPIT